MKKYAVIITILITLFLSTIVISIYFFEKSNHNQTNTKHYKIIPTAVPVPKQVTRLIDTVGQQTALPTGETPNVATVTNVTKLQSQLFFKNAKNGDKVLIYTNAKKAILYRPSTGEVIEITPLEIIPSGTDSIASDSATTNASSSPVLRIKL